MKSGNADNKPLVSVVIPVYNGSNYLRRAIDSVLAQTYENIEIIVVNDGSNDKGATKKIAESYGDSVRFFTKQNGGVSTALNMAIEKMKGQYFSWLSHDDEYTVDKVQTEVEYLREAHLLHKKAIAYSDYCVIDSRSKLISNAVIDHKLVTEKPFYAISRSAINGNTLLIPKQAFIDCGPFDTSLKCTQDYDLWLKMFEAGYTFVHVPNILIRSRYHKEQATQTSPYVISEGNALWLRIIKSLSRSERLKLNGSEYEYYFQLTQHIKDTPYDEAHEYSTNSMAKCEVKQITRLEGNVIGLSNELYSLNPFVRLAQIYRREGTRSVIKRATTKLAKKVTNKTS